MDEKLKSFLHNDKHFFGLLVITVALASFSLGRLSALEKEPNQEASVSHNEIKPTNQEVSVVATTTTSKLEGGEVVASKSGTKYHKPDCPGASQIKPANIITFKSAAAAAAAGYTPAANCPGL